jgi:hypothetical protein
VDTFAAGSCTVSLNSFGPASTYVTDPLWGTYRVRYFVISSWISCPRASEDLTAFAESIPTANTGDPTAQVEFAPCGVAQSCGATASWAHNDLIVTDQPICAASSAVAKIGTIVYGPYTPGFSAVPGFMCV